MSWTVVNADQLSNYYKQQQTAQNPYAAYYNQYNNQAANSQTPQIIQLPVSGHSHDSINKAVLVRKNISKCLIGNVQVDHMSHQ